MATRRPADDSSEEDEATALDLRPASRSARADASQPRPRGASPAPVQPAPRRVDLVDDSDEDEATEFLRRPADGARAPAPAQNGAEPVLRAQGRAVPLQATAPPAPAAQPQPAPVVAPASLSALPSMGAVDSHRPLPQRTIEATSTNSSGTASVPRVTRIQMMERVASTTGDFTRDDDHDRIGEDEADITIPPERVVMAPAAPSIAVPVTSPQQAPKARVATRVDASSDETQAGGDDDPDETQAPEVASKPAADSTGEVSVPRRVPSTAEGDPMPAKPRTPRPTLEPEQPHDGVLVVDAPAEATVTVNGVERGKGTIKVQNLDRDARHAVRIHCPGFAPWSGSVTLQGKQAAKIRPQLKPRGR